MLTLKVQLLDAHLRLTRPLSCWIPVFMLFTAVHRLTGYSSNHRTRVDQEGLSQCALHKDQTAHTHSHSRLLMMGGKFYPAASASLFFVLLQFDISGLN